MIGAVASEVVWVELVPPVMSVPLLAMALMSALAEGVATAAESVVAEVASGRTRKAARGGGPG